MFTTLTLWQFRRLVGIVAGRGGEQTGTERRWSLPLADRWSRWDVRCRATTTTARPTATRARTRLAEVHIEHVFARMKWWNILRNRRRKRDGVQHATRGIALMHNLALAS
ncbi:hypothetical protein GCM10009735_54150 [Actinomadura chokoriensis]